MQHNDELDVFMRLVTRRIADAVLMLVRPVVEQAKDEILTAMGPSWSVRTVKDLGSDPTFPATESALKAWHFQRENNGWSDFNVSSEEGNGAGVLINVDAFFRWRFAMKQKHAAGAQVRRDLRRAA